MGVNSCGTTLIDNGTFKNIGAITWDTTAKTSGFTAVSGNGYFVNTTSASITVTLPASPSAGDVVGIADYANTFDTNNLVIARNGSNIQGQADDFKGKKEGLSVVLIYVDATQGWISIDAGEADNINIPKFVTATGGTVTTSGDYKIHTFTSPGTFCVSCKGNAQGSNTVDYLVIAGGAGGAAGNGGGGGGGAGGYRFSDGTASGCYSAGPSPLGASASPVSVQGYPITIGGGGAGGCGVSTGASNGNPSVFSLITSAGGGGAGGGQYSPNFDGSSGGSGGGAGQNCSVQGTGGSGNTPPVSPPQGNNGGGAGGPGLGGSGGGGSGGNGVTTPGNNGTQGGPGLASSINASPVTRGGGGSGGTGGGSGAPPIGGGAGGSAAGSPGSAGTANTGGGGGGGSDANRPGGAGGSGIVIIRYKYQ